MAEKDPRVIGARIAKARQARDMTQAQLAAALGVAESTVANWERGTAYPKRKLGKIEQFFGRRLDYDEDANGVRTSDSVEEALDQAQVYIDRVREVHRRSLGKGNGHDDTNGDSRRASLPA